jgi:hypothetical protein
VVRDRRKPEPTYLVAALIAFISHEDLLDTAREAKAPRFVPPNAGRDVVQELFDAVWSLTNMAKRVGLLASAGLLIAVVVCGCGRATTNSEPAVSMAWETLPPAPLSPRENAIGLWTGEEVLLIGGSDAAPCPPTASCVPPDRPPLADGAAFDPERETWRAIAPSPVPFESAQGFVLGDKAYIWVPGTPSRPKTKRAFLAFDIQKNRWDELPLPAGGSGRDYAIVAAGDRIVAYAHSDEQDEQPDRVFDPSAGSWRELPADPLSPSFDRYFAWTGHELVLFDHELTANPGSEAPALTRAAAFDLESGLWRQLPDSEILATGPWVAIGDGRLVNPTTGGADGGEVNNWGRSYPFGGILDVARGEWSELPRPRRSADEPAAGVLTHAGAHYFGVSGLIFDATRERWLPIPALEGEGVRTGITSVAAGDDLVVFGGARWDSSTTDGDLTNDAFIWSPRT